MLGAVVADAFFGIAVFVETLAAISLLQVLFGFPLREELDPILAFYRSSISAAASFVPVTLPAWFADAYLLAFALFFFFFIAQARRATAPYDDPTFPRSPSIPRAEMVLDAALPVIACLLGAAFFSFTLLPLFSLIAALWLFLRKLAGSPSWFHVSRSYYANLVVVAVLTATIVSLPR